ncbi:hypothetical protein LG315_03480 [Microbacterium marinum]
MERLSDRYPNATAEQIEHAVDGAQGHFDRAAVRDFVPILIERKRAPGWNGLYEIEPSGCACPVRWSYRLADRRALFASRS